MKKVEYEKMRINIEAKLEEGDDLKRRVLDLLKDLVTIYDNCAMVERNRLLKALFPDGFYCKSSNNSIHLA